MREPDIIIDFLSSPTRHIAAKQHACTGCPHPIEPGQPYWRRAAKVEGAMSTSKTHGHPGDVYLCESACPSCIEETP